MQFPGSSQRPTQIEPTMDQNTGDAGQPTGLTQKYAFLEPRAVRKVVGTDPHEGQSGGRRTIAVRVGGATGLSGLDRVLPGAPVGRGPFPYGGVGVLREAGIGGDDVAVAWRARGSFEEAFPLLGEEPANAPVEPVDLRSPGHGDRGDDDLGHPLRV